MELHVSIEIWVTGDESEQEQVERMKQQIISDGLSRCERSVTVDESLLADVAQAVADLEQIRRRAQARLKGRD